MLHRLARDHGRWALPGMLALIMASGCAQWVQPTAAGHAVSVVSPGIAETCTRLGRVSAGTQARVGGVARNEERVAEELRTLARNEAADLGADAVVPTSEINEGRQTFDALRCGLAE